MSEHKSNPEPAKPEPKSILEPDLVRFWARAKGTSRWKTKVGARIKSKTESELEPEAAFDPTPLIESQLEPEAAFGSVPLTESKLEPKTKLIQGHFFVQQVIIDSPISPNEYNPFQIFLTRTSYMKWGFATI